MKNVPHNHLLNIRRMIIVAMRNVITKVMHCVINPSFTFAWGLTQNVITQTGISKKMWNLI